MTRCNLGQQLWQDYDESGTPAAWRAWHKHRRNCGLCNGNARLVRVITKRVLEDGRTAMTVEE
jgi:hypothetical protein